jgi:hypothetical protein
VNFIEISIKRPVFAWVLMFTLQPTEWQRIGSQINVPLVAARLHTA